MKAYNIYNKSIELTENEEKTLNSLLKICHPFKIYNYELHKYIDYNSTYYMENIRELLYSSGIERNEWVKAFKHLLINGIIEMIYHKDNDKLFLFRTTYKAVVTLTIPKKRRNFGYVNKVDRYKY